MTIKSMFSTADLAALRDNLLRRMLDPQEAVEIVHVFLMGRGYGASPEATVDAVGRVEMSGCSMPVLQKELESLALVM